MCRRVNGALSLAEPSIVAFHGFMGVGEDFEPLQMLVVFETPDLIGHGSFQCDDPTQYSLDVQLEYWFGRIPKGNVLIGYSMGGRLRRNCLSIPSAFEWVGPHWCHTGNRRSR